MSDVAHLRSCIQAARPAAQAGNPDSCPGSGLKRSISLRHSAAACGSSVARCAAQHHQQSSERDSSPAAEQDCELLKSGPGGCQLQDIAPERVGRRSCPLPHLGNGPDWSWGLGGAGKAAACAGRAQQCSAGERATWGAAHRSAPCRGSAAGRLFSARGAADGVSYNTGAFDHMRTKAPTGSPLAHQRPPARRSTKRRQRLAAQARAARCDDGWQLQLREAVARIAQTARQKPTPSAGELAAARASGGGSMGSSASAGRLEQRAASYQALERIEREVCTELSVLRSTLRL